MPSVCFYFQVHQPYRVGAVRYMDTVQERSPFDDMKNREICRKVANKCYLPMNAVLLELIKRYEGKFRVAFSISGVALEQFAEYTPEVLRSFQELVATGCVELLGETYYHSLAAVMDENEFRDQVALHEALLRELFQYRARTFRNTELIYSDRIGELVADLGYETVIAEGADDILGWKSPNYVYRVKGRETKLLLKNYRLSDDIAFRFSNQGWAEFPLTSEKFSHWVHQVSGAGDIVNLFMDYETFGEHQWESTGIFEFMRHLPEKIFAHPDWNFLTPSEVSARYPVRDEMNFFRLTSWADIDRDLTAWRGNRMQNAALEKVFSLRERVLELDEPALTHEWRKLLTSDHFYYMCTKWAADGDVHAYFSPYGSPYDAFIYWSNAFRGFERKLERLERESVIEERVRAELVQQEFGGEVEHRVA